jgi:hypothetical protein
MPAIGPATAAIVLRAGSVVKKDARLERMHMRQQLCPASSGDELGRQ